MNPVQNPTDAAHRDLQNVLLNGRILLNGMPLTGNELGTIVRGEQMLYEKSTQLDKANALVASQKKGPKNPLKNSSEKPKIIKLEQPKENK